MYCITNDLRKIESVKNPSYHCITHYTSIKCQKKTGFKWQKIGDMGSDGCNAPKNIGLPIDFSLCYCNLLGYTQFLDKTTPYIYIDIDIDSRFVLVLHSTSQLYRVCVALPAAPRTQYQALSRQEAGDVTLLFFGVSETQPIASSRIEMVVCQPLCYFRTKPCCSAPPSSKAHVRMQQVSRSANDRCGGAAFAGLSSTVSRAVNEISVRVVPSRLLYSAVNCIIAFYTISGQTMGKHLIFQY